MAVEVKLINEDDKPILDSGQVVINFAEPVSSFFFFFLTNVLSMSIQLDFVSLLKKYTQYVKRACIYKEVERASAAMPRGACCRPG